MKVLVEPFPNDSLSSVSLRYQCAYKAGCHWNENDETITQADALEVETTAVQHLRYIQHMYMYVYIYIYVYIHTLLHTVRVHECGTYTLYWFM